MSSVDEPTAVPPSSPSALAERHGLSQSARRPTLIEYGRELWSRRQFILAYARARTYAAYAGARLGGFWQVLTPLLNAGVYYLIFGVVLNASAGVPNYVAFLLTGMFVFTFTQRSVLEGAKSISSNLSLIRTLHFPRAALPFAYVLNELSQVGISITILVVVALATGEPVTWMWLLVVPAIGLQTMFNAGITMVFARWGAFVNDINQLMPFVLRSWLYVSGVFFSIPVFLRDQPRWLLELMALNPPAAYIDAVRSALLESHSGLPHVWLTCLGWAVVALIGGFLFFWQAEQRYGRG